MRQSLTRFSGPESSVRTQFLVDYITIMCGFRFSVHTASSNGRPYRNPPALNIARALLALGSSGHGLDHPPIPKYRGQKIWIIDDTGFPKQGRHSVGVARQYCGQLGKQDNCQVAVSLSIANHHASVPVAYQLYLPKDWAKDRARRRKAGVPKQISFKAKPRIALEQLRWACEAGLPRGVVLMDAGYGADTDLRANITTLGLSYVAA